MIQNLDVECAQLGSQLAESVDERIEKVLTNALSVLEEQGVYAFFLYLHAREGDAGKRISKDCENFVRSLLPSAGPNAAAGLFPWLQELAKGLDDLLFARDLLRQSLVYGRYHAKAKSAGGQRG
jgi:hypothetical protein